MQSLVVTAVICLLYTKFIRSKVKSKLEVTKSNKNIKIWIIFIKQVKLIYNIKQIKNQILLLALNQLELILTLISILYLN